MVYNTSACFGIHAERTLSSGLMEVSLSILGAKPIDGLATVTSGMATPDAMLSALRWR